MQIDQNTAVLRGSLRLQDIPANVVGEKRAATFIVDDLKLKIWNKPEAYLLLSRSTWKGIRLGWDYKTRQLILVIKERSLASEPIIPTSTRGFLDPLRHYFGFSKNLNQRHSYTLYPLNDPISETLPRDLESKVNSKVLTDLAYAWQHLNDNKLTLSHPPLYIINVKEGSLKIIPYSLIANHDNSPIAPIQQNFPYASPEEAIKDLDRNFFNMPDEAEIAVIKAYAAALLSGAAAREYSGPSLGDQIPNRKIYIKHLPSWGVEECSETPACLVRLGNKIGEGQFKEPYKALLITGEKVRRVCAHTIYSEDYQEKIEKMITRELAAISIFRGKPYLLPTIDSYVTYIGSSRCLEHITPLYENNLMDGKKCLKPANIIKILSDASKGLRSIHSCHFVYCDFKAENILFTKVQNAEGKEEYESVVADLGSGYLEGSLILGQVSPLYSSPEAFKVALGRHQPLPSYSHDIWSLGTVLMELMRGKTMENSASLLEVVNMFTTYSKLSFMPLEVKMQFNDALTKYEADVEAMKKTLGENKIDSLINETVVFASHNRPNINKVIKDMELILGEMDP